MVIDEAPDPEAARAEARRIARENADPALRCAYRVKRGHGIDGERDGIVVKNVLASYTHLRAAGGCDWPQRFAGFVRSCKTA
jgi:cobyrinic acid a,c-diamide synthase